MMKWYLLHNFLLSSFLPVTHSTPFWATLLCTIGIQEAVMRWGLHLTMCECLYNRMQKKATVLYWKWGNSKEVSNKTFRTFNPHQLLQSEVTNICESFTGWKNSQEEYFSGASILLVISEVQRQNPEAHHRKKKQYLTFGIQVTQQNTYYQNVRMRISPRHCQRHLATACLSVSQDAVK